MTAQTVNNRTTAKNDNATQRRNLASPFARMPKKDALSRLLRRSSDKDDLSGPTSRLATHDGIRGLRRRGTLDALLTEHVLAKPHQVEPGLWEALRIAGIPDLLLEHYPAHVPS